MTNYNQSHSRLEPATPKLIARFKKRDEARRKVTAKRLKEQSIRDQQYRKDLDKFESFFLNTGRIGLLSLFNHIPSITQSGGVRKSSNNKRRVDKTVSRTRRLMQKISRRGNRG